MLKLYTMGQKETGLDFTFAETYPFNNKFVTVAVTTADLRASFIAEATTQKCNPRRVCHINGVLDFGIDSLNAPEDNEPKAGGFVTFDGQSAFCQLNVMRAIELAEKGNKNPYFRIPKNMPDEAKDTAVVQALDGIWRHERQHLIQILKNQKNYSLGEISRRHGRYSHVENISKKVKLTGIGSALASLWLPPEYAIPGIIGCLSASVAALVIEQHTITQRYFRDPIEVDAYKYNRSELFTGLSPFKVIFET